MNQRKMEYSWLHPNEAVYFDDIQYRVEVECNPGCFHFYISTEHDPRPMSRELVDQYIRVLGIVVNPIPESKVPEHHEHGPECVEMPQFQTYLEPETEVVHAINELIQKEANLPVQDIMFDISLAKWASLFGSKATPYTDRYEYKNVAGYDKVVITEDMLAFYTGDYYEMIKVPETDEHQKLILGDALFDVVQKHEQMLASK